MQSFSITHILCIIKVEQKDTMSDMNEEELEECNKGDNKDVYMIFSILCLMSTETVVTISRQVGQNNIIAWLGVITYDPCYFQSTLTLHSNCQNYLLTQTNAL